jgi:sec-independent protein translocase protein TatC
MSDEKQPLTSHLADLRNRLIKSIGAVLVGFVVSFTFSEKLFKLLTLPLRADLHLSMVAPYLSFIPKKSPIEKLVFLAPAEAFWMHLKISIVSGIIITLPVALYQIWKFVAPGLLPKEKKYVGPFIIAGTGLFLMGDLFCFTIILPFAMNFLLNYKTASLTPMISVGSYVDFTLKFLLAFGAVFELPIVILFLTRMGVVTPKTLARHRKYAFLLAFVIAAFLTPTPDAFNQTLMAGPIILLYEAGILISRIFSRKDTSSENSEDQEKPD